MARVGRGGKFDRLPEDLKEKATKMLASGKHSVKEITDFINAELPKYSVNETDVESLDDNTVWRAGKKMKQLADDMQRTENAMQAVAGKVDLTSIGEQGQLLMSMLTSAIFKTTHGLIEGADPVDPETLGDLVLSVSRLQKSAEINQKLKTQLKAEAKKEALEEAAKLAEEKKSELEGAVDKVEFFRKQILGLKE